MLPACQPLIAMSKGGGVDSLFLQNILSQASETLYGMNNCSSNLQ